jgi:hypothetical protein
MDSRPASIRFPKNFHPEESNGKEQTISCCA